MMYGWDFGMAGGWMWLILGIILIVTIVALVGAVTRDRSSGGPERADPSSDAARILKTRLARGEISPQQYEQLRRQLGL